MKDVIQLPAQILSRDDGGTIAYRQIDGKPPCVIFLGGFMSDMSGTKAVELEHHCRSVGQAFLRFDYRGHGESSGDFKDATISHWLSDALAVIDACTCGPLILVGSSMGGWIMLLAALARSERIAGLIGIAAAPDFTRDLMWDQFSKEAARFLQHSLPQEVVVFGVKTFVGRGRIDVLKLEPLIEEILDEALGFFVVEEAVDFGGENSRIAEGTFGGEEKELVVG